MRETDVVLAGGGLNGSTLALALASVGLSVTIVEPRSAAARAAEGFDGRSYALALASQRLLKALDLWEVLAPEAQPILRIQVSDGRPGEGASPFVLDFDHAEIEEGPMGYMVEDRHLRGALGDSLAAQGVTLLEDAIVSQAPDGSGIAATLASGQRLRAALLIGCDGRESPTARRAGIGRTGWRYRQSALVCAVEHERPHGGTAHQFFMPEGPLAILPLKGNRSSIVWTQPEAQARAVMAADEASYLAALRPRFGRFLGEISLTGARWSYPLALSLANAFVAPRVALAGDAAHAVHPVAGQGLNAGLKDVATLSEVLAAAHRRGEDIGHLSVLQRYQRWRRFDATALAVATDAFNRLFSNDNPVLRLGRDLGLGAVGRSLLLRRAFIREAAGLTGEVPRLLRGLPL